MVRYVYVPLYPVMRILKGQTGECVLECTIDEKGKATGIQRGQQTHDTICNHAIHALKLWQFVPASHDGTYLPVTIRIPFGYELDRVRPNRAIRRCGITVREGFIRSGSG